MAMKLCAFLLAVVAIAAFQVEQSGSFSRSSLYLDTKHPGVYLTLEKKGPRKPHFPTESKTGVWLRFHNNMRVPVILLNANAAAEKLAATVYENGIHFLKDGAEVDACYDVQAVLQQQPPESTPTEWVGGQGELFHAPIPEESKGDSCYWRPAFRGDIGNHSLVLAPGTSAVFSVPENFVSSGLEISTQFSYAWESDDYSDVVHYVRYGGQVSTSSSVIDPKTGDLHFSIPVALTANAKQ